MREKKDICLSRCLSFSDCAIQNLRKSAELLWKILSLYMRQKHGHILSIISSQISTYSFVHP